MKNIYLIILGLAVFTMISFGFAFASYGGCGQESAAAASTASGSGAIDVGNKTCPVLGEPIDEASKATYEYKGKVYNFCCAGCIEAFKKEPQKYIDKVNQELESRQTNVAPK
ncbi:MAG: YHS domain-containing protein [Candidatus Omnitrophica bacterium]|nr:YHS domain-containing protein [Candidatus Omnitrophota bacterium]